ncbi:Uncharacterised protein [Candidatus Burarchaeum australiense]|nr:Uncharacterised protein [Candidatus Burarchaeum australiense]
MKKAIMLCMGKAMNSTDRLFYEMAEEASFRDFTDFLYDYREVLKDRKAVKDLASELRQFIKDAEIVFCKNVVPKGMRRVDFERKQDEAKKRLAEVNDLLAWKHDSITLLTILTIAFKERLGRIHGKFLVQDEFMMRVTKCAIILLDSGFREEAHGFLKEHMKAIVNSQGDLTPRDVIYALFGPFMHPKNEKIYSDARDLIEEACSKSIEATKSASECLTRAVVGKAGTHQAGRILEPSRSMLLGLAKTFGKEKDEERMAVLGDMLFARFYRRGERPSKDFFEFTLEVADQTPLATRCVSDQYALGLLNAYPDKLELMRRGCKRLGTGGHAEEMVPVLLTVLDQEDSRGRVMEVLKHIAREAPDTLLGCMEGWSGKDGFDREPHFGILRAEAREHMAGRIVIPIPSNLRQPQRLVRDFQQGPPRKQIPVGIGFNR